MPEIVPVLEGQALSRRFAVRRWHGLSIKKSFVHAVDSVTLRLFAGETLGVVGESGCGKSTLAKLLTGILAPSSGDIRFRGTAVQLSNSAARKDYSRSVQIVYQNAAGSLDPRMRVGDQLAEPLQANRLHPDPKAAVNDLFEQVGLSREIGRRFPHQLSGGQVQRLAIARALLFEPSVIICDEPVSALDLSVQAQVLNLLSELQRKHHVAYVFISHDLRVIRHVSHRVAVMYLGRIVEEATTDDLFADPRHPYTQSLLQAVPNPDPRRRGGRRLLTGEIPSPTDRPSGCAFHTRCALARPICRAVLPELQLVAGSQARVACHVVHGNR